MNIIFTQEKLNTWLTFNPGLALTCFRAARPWRSGHEEAADQMVTAYNKEHLFTVDSFFYCSVNFCRSHADY